MMSSSNSYPATVAGDVASAPAAARPSKTAYWVGHAVSALPVLMLFVSAGMKLARPPGIVEGMAKHGYSENVILVLGVVEALSTVLYLIPQTSVLGAILLTGYLGGATATHVSSGEIPQAFMGAIPFGVLLWLGLYLREPRLRVLTPWRR
jgi:DoxX-like protein